MRQQRPTPPTAPVDGIVLRVRRLSFCWGEQAVFNDLSFDLPPGVSLVTGDELSGKTTLLRILQGELQPSSGELCWPAGHASTWRTQPETPTRDALSARQWWATLGCDAVGPLQGQRAEALAEGFGLAPHLDKPLYMLSAGSRRKVELCTAFALPSDLTLIDNPFAALDAPSARFLIELLQEASEATDRAWLLADYEPPPGVDLAAVIDLNGR